MTTKSLIKLLLPLLLSALIYGQTTLVVGGDIKYSQFYRSSLTLAGGHLGVYSNSFFWGASGFTNYRHIRFTDNESTYQLRDISYGGFNIRFIPQSSSFFQFSAGCVLGGGFLKFEDDKKPRDIEDNLFFAFEPDLGIMLNLSLFVRLGGGVSYRGMLRTDFDLYNHPEISGFATGIYAQFGYLD